MSSGFWSLSTENIGDPHVELGGTFDLAHDIGRDLPWLKPRVERRQQQDPAFTPTGPYPAMCAMFDQLGFRLPLIAVSPFAKPHYVSHSLASHTSLLALLETRLSLPNLTARDASASDLEDLFDFDGAPSLNAPVGTAPLPRQPPAVTPGEPGCPF